MRSKRKFRYSRGTAFVFTLDSPQFDAGHSLFIYRVWQGGDVGWQSSEDSFLSFTPRSRPTRPPRRRGLTPGARSPWPAPRQSTAFPGTEIKTNKFSLGKEKSGKGRPINLPIGLGSSLHIVQDTLTIRFRRKILYQANAIDCHTH